MKKYILTLLWLLTVAFGSHYFFTNFIAFKNKSIIEFEKTTHDFDTLKNQADAELYFVFYNRGNSDLEINDIGTSCGCTIPSWSKNVIKPYEKDSFLVSYDIINKGYFIKEIMVYSNSSTSPDKLVIKGYVPFENN